VFPRRTEQTIVDLRIQSNCHVREPVSCQLSKIDVVSWVVVPILLAAYDLRILSARFSSSLANGRRNTVETVLPLARVCRASAPASTVHTMEIDPRHAARKCRCCTWDLISSCCTSSAMRWRSTNTQLARHRVLLLSSPTGAEQKEHKFNSHRIQCRITLRYPILPA